MGQVESSQEQFSSNIYENVIRLSKDLEQFLEVEFGATGRGLHEKITCVQNQMSPELVKRLRFLATCRNQLLHSNKLERMPSNEELTRAYHESKSELQAIVNQRRSRGNSHQTNTQQECRIL